MVIAGQESVEHLIETAAILKSIESFPQVTIFLHRMTESSKRLRYGVKKIAWISIKSVYDYMQLDPNIYHHI